MKQLFFIALLLLAAIPAQADVLYTQPPAASGVVLVSSRAYPNPSDSDIYVYDSFIPQTDAMISEVRWRGGYVNGAPYGHVVDFSVFFYESIAGGSEPLVGRPEGETRRSFLRSTLRRETRVRHPPARSTIRPCMITASCCRRPWP